MTQLIDHDVLLVLSTQMSGQAKILDDLVKKVDEISTKIDALRDEQRDHGQRIKAVEHELGDSDIRMATLEQQVRSLRDDADQRAKARVEREREAEEKNRILDRKMKMWAFVITVISFLIAISPKIFEMAQKLVAP